MGQPHQAQEASSSTPLLEDTISTTQALEELASNNALETLPLTPTYEEPIEEPLEQPTSESLQEPLTQPTEEEVVPLSQLPNMRRRPREEEEQPGRENPLERIPLDQEVQGPWPPTIRSLMIYLENTVDVVTSTEIMLEGQFANMDEFTTIIRTPILDGHEFRTLGPLHILPRERRAVYILEVMQQLLAFFGM